MSLKQLLAVDRSKSSEGKWFDYAVDPQNEKMIRFKLRYMNKRDRSYMNAVAKYGRKDRATTVKQQEIDFDALEKLEGINKNAFVDTIVVDWENVLEFREERIREAGSWDEVNQKPTSEVWMPFTKANLKFLLNEFPQLFDDLTAVAGDWANFREYEDQPEPGSSDQAKIDEEAAKN